MSGEMKIGWMTSIDADPATALYGRTVSSELKRRGVSVLTLPGEADSPRSARALRGVVPMLFASVVTPHLIESLDICVVNFAGRFNPLPYGDIWWQARTFAIFHGGNGDSLDDSLGHAAHKQKEGAIETSLPVLAPISLAALLAVGAVVHEARELEIVRSACPGPVLHLPLLATSSSADPAVSSDPHSCPIEWNKVKSARDLQDRVFELRVWAEKKDAVNAYVDALEDALRRALDAAPRILAARALGGTLAQFGMTSGDPFIDRVDRLTIELFPPDETIVA